MTTADLWSKLYEKSREANFSRRALDKIRRRFPGEGTGIGVDGKDKKSPSIRSPLGDPG
jgi:hypothetical protein